MVHLQALSISPFSKQQKTLVVGLYMLLAYINLLHCYKRKEARQDNTCVLVSSVAPYSWWYLVFVGL